MRVLGSFDLLMAELLAFRLRLKFAIDPGFCIHKIKEGSLNAVRAVNKAPSLDHSWTVVKDIRNLLLLSGNDTCKFVPRDGNKDANQLARMAFSLSVDSFAGGLPYNYSSICNCRFGH